MVYLRRKAAKPASTATGSSAEQEACALAVELRMLSIPVVPRLIADDATLEAFNVWSVWTTAAKAAAGQWKKDKSRKLRARDDNPCAGIAAPDRDGDKELQLLYPNEFIALISCEDVPLEYRRLYALVTYLFLRGGELKALTWPDVDIDRGIVSVRRTYDRNTGRIKLRTAEAVGESSATSSRRSPRASPAGRYRQPNRPSDVQLIEKSVEAIATNSNRGMR
jgi:integrase